ncbi:uncharacterized protein LOC135943866 [Cloeon dipterum]|uniref:uncharacterized protein LOC135943866 n=1 Tax=Cloeon dipterum TaxID=197152 RepID=UPI00322082BE
MTLLAVTSLKEIECMNNFEANNFWTSGSNEDNNCNVEKKYAWCSTGINMSENLIETEKLWLPPNNAIPSTAERCLAVSISKDSSKQGLVHRKCDDALPFICQYSVDCPKSCIKDITWLNSYRQCCALGMETLNIDNAAEQLGLTALAKANKANWTANFNYWTSGTGKGAPEKQWSWCKPNGPTVFAKGLVWEKLQPDNKGDNESCVHFRFILNSTGTIMTDRNCANKYIFACKSDLKTTPKPCVASCPTEDCKRNPSLFGYDSLTSQNFLRKYAPETFGDFWLSGTDLGCDSNFRWCTLSRDFVHPELTWKEGHPKPDLDCVYLEVRNESVLLATDDCAHNKSFLCEVRKKATFGRAMQTECAETWDITVGVKSIMTLGDTEFINQTHEVWCRSRTLLPDALYQASSRYQCGPTYLKTLNSVIYGCPLEINDTKSAFGKSAVTGKVYPEPSKVVSDVQTYVCEKP